MVGRSKRFCDSALAVRKLRGGISGRPDTQRVTHVLTTNGETPHGVLVSQSN